MQVHLTLKSGNRKVGAIPVSTTEAASCPDACPMKGTDCYARFGPLGMHWAKVLAGARGNVWSLFCAAVSKFAAGQLWRHNQAGDLPQNSKGKIHKTKCRQLSRASRHTNGWTYTHYDPTDEHNRQAIQEMNSVDGMTVNLSADSIEQADQYYAMGIAPVTVVLPKSAKHMGNRTPAGHVISVCPAQTQENVSCETCKLCQKRDRKAIVGFLAHGPASKRLSQSLEA